MFSILYRSIVFELFGLISSNSSVDFPMSGLILCFFIVVSFFVKPIRDYFPEDFVFTFHFLVFAVFHNPFDVL